MPPLGNMVGLADTPQTRHQIQRQAVAMANDYRGTGDILTSLTTTITTSCGAITNTTVWPEWNAILYTQSAAVGSTSLITDTNMTYTQQAQIWTAWNRAQEALSWTASDCNRCTTNPDWVQIATNTIHNAAWTVWNDRYDTIQEAGAIATNIQRYSRRKLTEEELLVELAREKFYREEAEKQRLAAEMAQSRAERLLRACLSPKQIDDLEKKNCFYLEVENRYGQKERYRIDRGSHGNVKQIDDRGSIIRSFCIQPPDVPAPDAMLAQKLFLEGSEEAREQFWETANITTLMKEKEVPLHIPRGQRRQYAQQHGLLH